MCQCRCKHENYEGDCNLKGTNCPWETEQRIDEIKAEITDYEIKIAELEKELEELEG